MKFEQEPSIQLALKLHDLNKLIKEISTLKCEAKHDFFEKFTDHGATEERYERWFNGIVCCFLLGAIEEEELQQQ